MLEQLLEYWVYIAAAVERAVSLLVSGHVVLNKRDTRAAIGWVGVVWLTPLLGAVLYVLFGINRIQRRAQSLRSDTPSQLGPSPTTPDALDEIEQNLGPGYEHLGSLAKLVGDVSHRPLLPGNKITPLVDGDEAYPAILDAIDRARKSITLSTYIFDNDDVGRQFLAALERAVSRDVAVRVLLDDVGARYSWPSMLRQLRNSGVPVARFLPTLVPGRFRYSNLRNHRKILVIDGTLGFTGGMNIRAGNVMAVETPHPIQDIHFRIEGPVVAHLQEVFISDWRFATDEVLEGEPWVTAIEPAGSALARGISDGPDEDFERFQMTILGALACARSSVTIVTPYFLPEGPIITSLNVAALKGIDVDIVLPQKNNLALVQWASASLLPQLLERGCRIWLSPPPFDHSKLMLVDDAWCLIGSANWDPRSLRLNFEFDVECYDHQLTGTLAEIARRKMNGSTSLTQEDLNRRSLAVRIRDGIAGLATPYL